MFKTLIDAPSLSTLQAGPAPAVAVEDQVEPLLRVDAVLPAVTLAASGAFEAVAVEDTVTVEDVAARFARVLVERTTP